MSFHSASTYSFYSQEEEEEDFAEYDMSAKQAEEDPRDAVIMENERQYHKLQKHFRGTVVDMRNQLREYVQQSTKIQTEMLNRIIQLKEQINAINLCNEVCGVRKTLPKNSKKKSKKSKSQKSKKSKSSSLL